MMANRSQPQQPTPSATPGANPSLAHLTPANSKVDLYATTNSTSSTNSNNANTSITIGVYDATSTATHLLTKPSLAVPIFNTSDADGNGNSRHESNKSVDLVDSNPSPISQSGKLHDHSSSSNTPSHHDHEDTFDLDDYAPPNSTTTFRRGSNGKGFIVDNYRGDIPEGYVLIPKGNNKLTNLLRSRALAAKTVVYLCGRSQHRDGIMVRKDIYDIVISSGDLNTVDKRRLSDADLTEGVGRSKRAREDEQPMGEGNVHSTDDSGSDCSSASDSKGRPPTSLRIDTVNKSGTSSLDALASAALSASMEGGSGGAPPNKLPAAPTDTSLRRASVTSTTSSTLFGLHFSTGTPPERDLDAAAHDDDEADDDTLGVAIEEDDPILSLGYPPGPHSGSVGVYAGHGNHNHHHQHPSHTGSTSHHSGGHSMEPQFEYRSVTGLGSITARNASRSGTTGMAALLPPMAPQSQPPLGYRNRRQSATSIFGASASHLPGMYSPFLGQPSPPLSAGSLYGSDHSLPGGNPFFQHPAMSAATAAALATILGQTSAGAAAAAAASHPSPTSPFLTYPTHQHLVSPGPHPSGPFYFPESVFAAHPPVTRADKVVAAAAFPTVGIPLASIVPPLQPSAANASMSSLGSAQSGASRNMSRSGSMESIGSHGGAVEHQQGGYQDMMAQASEMQRVTGAAAATSSASRGSSASSLSGLLSFSRQPEQHHAQQHPYMLPGIRSESVVSGLVVPQDIEASQQFVKASKRTLKQQQQLLDVRRQLGLSPAETRPTRTGARKKGVRAASVGATESFVPFGGHTLQSQQQQQQQQYYYNVSDFEQNLPPLPRSLVNPTSLRRASHGSIEFDDYPAMVAQEPVQYQMQQQRQQAQHMSSPQPHELHQLPQHPQQQQQQQHRQKQQQRQQSQQSQRIHQMNNINMELLGQQRAQSVPPHLEAAEGEPSTSMTNEGKEKRKRRPNHKPNVTAVLFKWLTENQKDPYPSDQTKKELATLTGLTIAQVNDWFINARRRYL